MWVCNCPDELYHHGKLGMHWGKRSATTSTKINKSPKGKLHFDEKMLMDGKTLTDGLIGHIGGMAVSQIVGGALMSTGSTYAGKAIATFGTAYALGGIVGQYAGRIHR